LYGTVEYLMMLQEGETVRLNRQARKAASRRNDMDAHRVPNLEEMDEQDAHRFLTDLYSRLSPEEESTTCATRTT
jgi:hypothetical protein